MNVSVLPLQEEPYFPPCLCNKWCAMADCLCFLFQSFEKQGFHAGTPAASFSLPSALGSGGPINPPAAAGYAPAPFMHILAPHQQPHSQILHHHLQQDGQVAYIYLCVFLYWIRFDLDLAKSTNQRVVLHCEDDEPMSESCAVVLLLPKWIYSWQINHVCIDR